MFGYIFGDEFHYQMSGINFFSGEAAEGGGDGLLRGLRGEGALLQAGTQG